MFEAKEAITDNFKIKNNIPRPPPPPPTTSVCGEGIIPKHPSKDKNRR